MPLMRYRGKLLKRNGKLARSRACCCIPEFCHTACVTGFVEIAGMTLQEVIDEIGATDMESWVPSAWHLALIGILYAAEPAPGLEYPILYVQFQNCGGYPQDETEDDVYNAFNATMVNTFGPTNVQGRCFTTPCTTSTMNMLVNGCYSGHAFPGYAIIQEDSKPCPCP